MRLLSTIQCLAGGLALVLGLLAGCQRASYSFQGPPAPAVPAAAAVSADTAAAKNTLRAIGAAMGQPPAVAATAARRPRAHPAVWRPAVARAAPKKLFLPALTSRYLKQTGLALDGPDEPKPYHKGVAFALAVVLGLLGAHQFYLRRNDYAWRYLLFTLVCVTLCLVAVPLANSVFIGGGLGGFTIALYLLVAGFAGLGYAYLHVLVDAVRILQGKLKRRE